MRGDLKFLDLVKKREPRKYYSCTVWLVADREIIAPPFTGKLVKTLLINSNPKLQEVFGDSGKRPKPLHITPLGKISRGGRVRFLWKSSGKQGVITISPREKYFISLGFSEEVFKQVFDALISLQGVEVYGAKWSIVEYSLMQHAIPSSETRIKIDRLESITVEFRTPANLVDPYKKSRFKRFLPLPGILFSYNIGELLEADRSSPVYMNAVNLVNRVLNETYSVLDTVKKTMYIYDGDEIPGIIGYVKYFIDWNFIDEDVKFFIENILEHASVMGVGSGRANGFGHITIKLPEQYSSPTMMPSKMC